MYTYEMDVASIVEDTEWTRFGLQTDGWMDGGMVRQMNRQMDKVKPVYLLQLHWWGG